MPEFLPGKQFNDKNLIPISEAAEYLGISIDTVRRWDKAGKIHATRPNGKDRYFSLTELERIKFSKPLSITEAAEKLNLSPSTLRRLEKRGIIKPDRDSSGVRQYTEDCLKDFASSEYFLSRKKVEEKILEPQKKPIEKKVPKEAVVQDIPDEVKSESTVARRRFVDRILGEQQQKIRGLWEFRSMLTSAGLFLATTFILLISMITIFFLVFPLETAEFFGYYRPALSSMALSKENWVGYSAAVEEPESGDGPMVLGSSVADKPEAHPIGKILKPVSKISLSIVKQIDEETYWKIVPKQTIEDVNDIFAINEEGDLVVLYDIEFAENRDLYLPESSNVVVENLDAMSVQGHEPGADDGDLAIFGAGGTITGLTATDFSLAVGSVIGGSGGIILDESITDADLASDSVLSDEIKDGTIVEADLADDSVTGAKIDNRTIEEEDLADDAVTSDKIKDGEIATADLDGSSVTSAKISDNTITAADLAATLTFADGDLLDLSAILHDDTAQQGILLPNVASASPTSPSTGEGYLSYDTSGDQVLVYNGSSWVQVGSGDITAVTVGNGLSGGGGSGDLTINLDVATTGTTSTLNANSGLEVASDGLSLLRGCADNQIIKWDSGSEIWQCESDSGGSGSAVDIEVDDGMIVSGAATIDFLGDDFNVTASPATEGNVSIDYSTSNIVRSDQAETITGGWAFDTAATTFTTGIDSNGDLSIADTDIALDGATTNFTSTGDLSFNTNDLVIEKSSSMIGIGTTNPTVALDVVGAITASGTITGGTLTDGTASITSGAVTGVTDLTMSGTLDVGTNTLYDGNLTGSWAFNSGNLSGIGTLAAGSTVTFSGLSASTDNTVLLLNASNQLITAEIDPDVWTPGTLLDGSGTANYITRFSDSDTLADSAIFQSGTSIGIGTTAPSATLNVVGDFTADNVNLNGNSVAATNDSGIYLLDNGGAGLFVEDGGNVGIGVADPSFKLDVTGDARVLGSLGVGLDVSNALDFGSNTMTFMENNLRVFFDDTSNTSAFPRNDWRIAINDSADGGDSYFGIEDVTWGTRPFSVGSSAPAGSLFIESNTGEVGVGTTSPAALFSVGLASPFTVNTTGAITAATGVTSSGTITFTGLSASTDDTVVILNASNELITAEIDPDVWTAGTLLDGSGTANYLSRFSDSDTLADSAIFQSGTSIGIGTTAPSATLSVVGDFTTDSVNINGDTVSATGNLGLYLNDNANNGIFVEDGGNVGIGATNPSALLSVGASNQFTVDSSGIITAAAGVTSSGTITFTGLATDTSNTVVIINGSNELITAAIDPDVWTAGTLIDGSGTGDYVPLWTDSDTLTNSAMFQVGSSIGIGTTAPSATLNVVGDFTVDNVNVNGNIIAAADNGGLFIYDNASNGIFVEDGGQVGIGTTAPAYTLDVNGDIRIASGSDLYVDTIGLNDTGTDNTDSGAALVGVFDEFTNSSSTTVQDVLDDLDSAIGGAGGLFTDGGAVSYLTSQTDDLAVGGTGPAAPFFFDESAEILTLTNTTNGLSFRVNDQSSDTTSFIIDEVGNVGIGATGASALLSVGATNQFTVDSSGIITAAAGVTSSGTITFTGLATDTSNTVVVINGSNELITAAIDPDVWTAGTLLDGSGTANYLSRFSDSDTLADSAIFQSGTSIGIGTTAPSATLNVVGDFTTDSVNINADTISATGNMGLYLNDNANNGIFVEDGGNVGIGATNPSALLSVGASNQFTVDSSGIITAAAGVTSSGTITFTGLATDTSNTVVIINGSNELITAAIDPDVWTAGTLIDGSGTGDYVPLWTDSDTLTNSAMFQVGSSIGVGTTAPSATLSVVGDFTVDNVNVNGNIIAAVDNGGLFIYDNASNGIFVEDGGQVGIGTTAPSYTLDVNGDIRIASGSDLYVDTIGLNDVGTDNTDSGAALIGVFDELGNSNGTTVQDVLDDLDSAIGGGGSKWSDIGDTTFLTSETDNIAVGGSGPAAPFYFDEGAETLTLTNTTTDFSFRVNDVASDTSPFLIDADGNVGIGTSGPAYKLDVAGDIRIASGSDLYVNTIGLNDTGTDNTDSGAALVGVFDEFGNSSGTTVQDVLDDLDSAIGGGGSKWTDIGVTTFLTSETDNLAVGGTGPAAPFYLDEGAEILTLTNTTNGLSFRVNDQSSDTTSFVIDSAGNVGIGATGASALLSVGATNQFTVDSSGIITAAAGVTSSGTITFTGLATDTSNTVVIINGSNELITAAIDPDVWTAGTLVDGSGSANYLPIWSDTDTIGNSSLYELSGLVGIGGTAPDSLLSVGTTNQFRVDGSGNVGIGATNPAAFLAIKASTTSAAQLNLANGTDPSSPNEGDFWYNGTNLYFRDSGSSNDLLAGGSGLWTDIGPVSYLTSLTDDVAIGDTGPGAPFYFDEGAEILTLTNSTNGLSFRVNDQANDTTSFIVDEAGNVGIGATGASALLSVGATNQFTVDSSGIITAAAGVTSSGTITFTGLATDTSNTVVVINGSNELITAAIDPDVWTAGTLLDGTGTGNYISRFSDSDTLADSAIFQSGTSIGIGTTAPSATLSVVGDFTTDSVNINGDTISATGNLGLYLNDNAGNGIFIEDAGNIGIGSTNPSALLSVGASNQFTVDSSGIITAAAGVTSSGTITFTGLATDTSNTVVIINGSNELITAAIDPDVWTAGTLIDGSGTGDYVPLWTDSDTLTNSAMFQVGSSLGVGTTAPLATLSVVGDFTTDSVNINADTISATGNLGLYLNDNANNGIFVEDGGNVGIGATNPSALLSVGASNQFTVDSSGIITAAAGITSSGTITFTGLATDTSNTVVVINGSNELITAAIDPDVWTAGTLLDGTGTANYISRFSDSDTLADSAIFQSGTSIGIGTTAPSATLGVVGDFTTDSININADTISATGNLGLYLNDNANNGIFVEDGGNVGIGATNPSALLSVGASNQFTVDSSGIITAAAGVTSSGTITFTGLATDTSNTVVIINGSNELITAAIDPDVWTAGTLIDGSGTGDYVPLWTDSDTLTNSAMFQVGSSIGIGTTAPSATLNVVGDFTVDNVNVNGNIIAAVDNGGLFIYDNASNGIFVEDGGQVGIGTTAPAYTLDVNGDIRIASGSDLYVDTIGLNDTGTDNTDSGAALVGVFDEFGNSTGTTVQDVLDDLDSAIGGGGSKWSDIGDTTFLTSETDNIAVGGSGPVAPFYFDEGAETLTLTNTTTDFSFVVNDASSDTSPFLIDADGNVGIGTSGPAYKLDVAGDIRIASGSDLYVNTIGLNDVGTDNTDSGAALVGVFDEFGNSSGTTVQDVLDDLDSAIGGGGSKWSDIGATTFLTSETDNLAVGGSGPAAPFYLDEGAEILTLTNTTNGLSFRVNDQSSDTTSFIIDEAGNVGIGATGASALLSVGATNQFTVDSSGIITAAAGVTSSGTITFTGLATDTSNTVVIINGSNELITAAIDPDVWTAGTLLDGTGTANYISRFSDSDTLADSAIFQSGTSIGIGTTAPSATLSVVGDFTTDSVNINGDTISATGNMGLYLNDNAGNGIFIEDTGNIGIGSTNPSALLSVGVSNQFTVDSSGIITAAAGVTSSGTITFSGLATDTSNTVVIINGSNELITAAIDPDVWTAGTLIDGSGTGDYVPLWTDSDTLTNSAIFQVGSSLGVGTTAPLATLSVVGDFTTDSVNINADTISATGNLGLYLNDNANNGIFVEDGGNVGIGATNPSALLSVGASNQFTVDSSGIITAAAGVTSSGTITFSGLATDTSNTVVVINGSNELITAAIDPDVWTAGTLIDGSGTGDYVPLWTDSDTLTNSAMFQVGSSLGVGTTAPLATLSVVGDFTTDSVNINADTISATGNMGLYLNDNANNGIFVEDGGNVGIGATNPSALLSVGASNQFTVDSSGIITAAAGVTSSGTITFTGLATDTSNTVVVISGSNELITAAIDPDVWTAGTLVDGSGSANYLPIWSDTDTIGNSSLYELSGLVGIGGTAPDSLLSVGTSNQFRVDGSGNVGIGATNPAAFLAIKASTTSAAQINFANGTDPSSPNEGDFWYNGTNLYFRDSGSSNDLLAGGSGLWTDGDDVTWLTSLTDDVAIGDTGPGAPFFFDEGAEILTLTNSTNGLSFRVNDQANDTTSFVIDSAGNVGIGATGASALLSVGATNQFTIDSSGIITAAAGVTSSGTITFSGLATDTSNTVVIINGSNELITAAIDPDVWTAGTLIDGSGSANYLPIWSDTDTIGNSSLYELSGLVGIGGTAPDSLLSVGTTNQFRVDGSGNVGIGATNPAAFLAIKASTTSAAQINFANGTDPSSPNEGDFWYNGTNLYFRDSGSSNDLLAGGSGLWTDGDDVTWLTSLTDDVAIGDTGPGAPFFFDEGAEILTLTNSTNGLSFRVNDQANDTTSFIIDETGNVGIGSTGASALLSVGPANEFTVDSAGTITAVVGITSSGAIAANAGITFDEVTDTVGAHQAAGTYNMNLNIIQNIGATGTDFTTAGGLTIAIDEATTALSVDNVAQAASIFIANDNGTPVFTIADGGVITATQNINADGGIDVDDVFVVADGGAVTANTDVDLVLAGTENFVIGNTTAGAGDVVSLSYTTGDATDGLDIAATSSGDATADNINGLVISWTETGDADVFNALSLANTTSTNSVTTGLTIGTGWDTGISIASGALVVNSDSITSDGDLVINASSKVLLGDGTTNYFDFDEAAGPTYYGTAMPTKVVTLIPEFPGAVLTGDGGSNTGTMTSDFCSFTNTNPPDINTSVCTQAGALHNYYSWQAQATNDYDIWVNWQVPSDFSEFSGATAISFYGWRDSASDTVTLTLYDDENNICGSATATGATYDQWVTTNYADPTGCDASNIAAGDIVTFRFQLLVGVNDEYARAGEITISYEAKF